MSSFSSPLRCVSGSSLSARSRRSSRCAGRRRTKLSTSPLSLRRPAIRRGSAARSPCVRTRSQSGLASSFSRFFSSNCAISSRSGANAMVRVEMTKRRASFPTMPSTSSRTRSGHSRFSAQWAQRCSPSLAQRASAFATFVHNVPCPCFSFSSLWFRVHLNCSRSSVSHSRSPHTLQRNPSWCRSTKGRCALVARSVRSARS